MNQATVKYFSLLDEGTELNVGQFFIEQKFKVIYHDPVHLQKYKIFQLSTIIIITIIIIIIIVAFLKFNKIHSKLVWKLFSFFHRD